MKLNEYIVKREIELVEEGNRSAKYRSLNEATLKVGYTTIMLDLTSFENKLDENIEIEPVDELTVEKPIDVIELNFNIVKPRCKKPVYYSEYVRIV